uniref:WD_REPEATS_REGION domain-containing protein n=1 Tax=Haemonchus placei TaxID=6290 RepID=A0A0N4VW65_HAEPC
LTRPICVQTFSTATMPSHLVISDSCGGVYVTDFEGRIKEHVLVKNSSASSVAIDEKNEVMCVLTFLLTAFLSFSGFSFLLTHFVLFIPAQPSKGVTLSFITLHLFGISLRTLFSTVHSLLPHFLPSAYIFLCFVLSRGRFLFIRFSLIALLSGRLLFIRLEGKSCNEKFEASAICINSVNTLAGVTYL